MAVSKGRKSTKKSTSSKSKKEEVKVESPENEVPLSSDDKPQVEEVAVEPVATAEESTPAPEQPKAVEEPKKEALKPAPKKSSSSKEIAVDSIVKTQHGDCKVLSIHRGFARLSLVSKPHKIFTISINKLKKNQ
jgi:septal ring-binding cell division protein DamX